MQYEKELKAAIQAARNASEEILKYYGRSLDIQDKGHDSPVTIADHEANRVILETLQSNFPNDGYLSEETKDSPDRLEKERVWIIDPLDGTKEFINEIPEFAVSIALSIKGESVVGVILNPATAEIYHAVKDQGAYLNDVQISVSQTANLKEAQILASRSEIKRGEWKIFEGKFDIIPSGGMAYKMVTVAQGRADASFTLTPKNEWDFAAGLLILKEAGGTTLSLLDKEFTLNEENPLIDGMVYSNTHLHKSLTKLIKPHYPKNIRR